MSRKKKREGCRGSVMGDGSDGSEEQNGLQERERENEGEREFERDNCKFYFSIFLL